MVIAALRLDVDLEEIDMQNICPDFIKVNPQHTVPTLVDEGYAIWESRAIARYLANQYDSNNTLYPMEPLERGTIDSRLDFDLGTLCPSFAQYFQPQVFSNTPPAEAQVKKLKDALSYLNTFLEGRNYAVGSQLTIADLALVASVSTIDAAEVNLEPYPNITRWFQLIKESAPGYKKYNEKGLSEFKRMVANMKKVRADMTSLPNQLPSATSANPTVNSQDEGSQAGPALVHQHNIFKMLYENRPSVGSNTLAIAKQQSVHRSTNVAAKPYTQADLLNQFRNFKADTDNEQGRILEHIKNKKSNKHLEAKHTDCSCSSHSADDTISEEVHISMVNRPNIGPMLVLKDSEDSPTPTTTSPSSKNRFFGSRKIKHPIDVRDTGAGCSQTFGLHKHKKTHTQ